MALPFRWVPGTTLPEAGIALASPPHRGEFTLTC
jgi:hypothetical protein